MYDTIPVKTKRNDDVVITMDGYEKSNYKWDPVQKKVVYTKKGTGATGSTTSQNKISNLVKKKIDNLQPDEINSAICQYVGNLKGRMDDLKEDIKNNAAKELIKEDIQFTRDEIEVLKYFRSKVQKGSSAEEILSDFITSNSGYLDSIERKLNSRKI